MPSTPDSRSREHAAQLLWRSSSAALAQADVSGGRLRPIRGTKLAQSGMRAIGQQHPSHIHCGSATTPRSTLRIR